VSAPYSSSQYSNVAGVIPKGSNDPSAPGIEASLDIEFIMGVAPNVTTYFYASATFDFWSGLSTWAALVASEARPPLVISVSYGDQDPSDKPDLSYMLKLDKVFQQIGALGTTIVFASGDSGAGCSWCFYDAPSFPAPSPHVLSVGATRFIGGVLNGPEMAVDEFGSGGGFSWSFGRPKYQDAAVTSYLNNYASTLPFGVQFAKGGRATPDVAALGIGFNVINGGVLLSVGGTSASAPTVGAIISTLNTVRLRAGKAPMGFINPFIYSTYAQDPSIVFDVTRGSNADSCCVLGFTCVPGWDAVTGAGTLNVKNLLKYL